jgi:hypothetical protein
VSIQAEVPNQSLEPTVGRCDDLSRARVREATGETIDVFVFMCASRPDFDSASMFFGFESSCRSAVCDMPNQAQSAMQSATQSFSAAHMTL